MKEYVSESKFIYKFEVMNRKEDFSYNGRKALYNYIINLEEDTKQEIELDIIAICCEYAEYQNLNEYLKNYTTDINKEDFEEEGEFNAEDYEKAIFEEIGEKTTIIEIGEDEEGFIIQQY